MGKKLGLYSLIDSDDDGDGHGYDAGSYAWSASHGIIDFDSGSFARGGKPGHGSPPPPPPPPPTGTPAPYTSGNPLVPDSQEFNVKIVFQGGNWTDSLVQGFKDAADAISSFIKGDIPDINLFGENIDDIRINASIVTIDGSGGILGQAGPDYIRSGSLLPISATMQFDVADASNYDSMHLMDDIDLHEMLHSVGFGTIWSQKGLIAGANTSTPTFIGAQATAAYDATGHTGSPRVEDGGGSGTALSHWDEQTFGNELMTGYINNPNTFTYMTVASLGDIGYQIVSLADYHAPTFI